MSWYPSCIFIGFSIFLLEKQKKSTSSLLCCSGKKATQANFQQSTANHCCFCYSAVNMDTFVLWSVFPYLFPVIFNVVTYLCWLLYCLSCVQYLDTTFMALTDVQLYAALTCRGMLLSSGNITCTLSVFLHFPACPQLLCHITERLLYLKIIKIP